MLECVWLMVLLDCEGGDVVSWMSDILISIHNEGNLALKYLKQIINTLNGLVQTVGSEKGVLSQIAATNQQLLEQNTTLLQNQTTQGEQLDQILKILEIPPAKSFFITLEEGDVMATTKKAKATAGVDIQLADDGTATATLTFEDSEGVQLPPGLPAGVATPTWAASDATPGPSALSLTPSGDGTTCKIAVTLPSPPPSPLPTGLTVSATVASGLVGQTSPQTETSQGIDVTAGAAGQFAVALSEP